MVTTAHRFDQSSNDVVVNTLRSDADTETRLIWDMLDQVKDPEIPVLSLWDLGVLRNVEKIDHKVIVTITPTYSGCPAMDTMRDDIANTLNEAGYPDIEVRSVLSPAWTTDWLSVDGKKKLEKFGIAPPAHTKSVNSIICCPRCRSKDTSLISEYGSTACKAMYQCNDCKDAFCYFKVI